MATVKLKEGQKQDVLNNGCCTECVNSCCKFLPMFYVWLVCRIVKCAFFSHDIVIQATVFVLKLNVFLLFIFMG